ncbi:hypothetical protein EBZ37_07460, partial [bacterium]|nr:hypothetical protein [bacterium]
MSFLKWLGLGDSQGQSSPNSSSGLDFHLEVITPLNQVLRALLVLLYVLAGGYSLFLIWNHLNYVQVDLAGHMASGAWFKRGYFHQYQDANFLGYVHGLFYPPLEDLILTGFSLL